jgi:hypothetical protein
MDSGALKMVGDEKLRIEGRNGLARNFVDP